MIKKKTTYAIISKLKTIVLLLILKIGILPRAVSLILLAFLKLFFFSCNPSNKFLDACFVTRGSTDVGKVSTLPKICHVA